MPSLLAFAAPVALILPVLGHVGLGAGLSAGLGVHMQAGGDAGSAPISAQPTPDYDEPSEAPYSRALPEETQIANPLDALHQGQVRNQVRIDRRVIIRISPQRSSNRGNLLARLPRNGLRTRFEERDMDRCLPVNRISGVQTGTGNRLLLFLSDNRIVSVNLERACRARDFYSGFYVERSDDGQICVDRDELQSRSGAKCEVERMRQLVAVRD